MKITESSYQSSNIVQRMSEIKLLLELFIFCSVCVFYDTNVCTLKPWLKKIIFRITPAFCHGEAMVFCDDDKFMCGVHVAV